MMNRLQIGLVITLTMVVLWSVVGREVSEPNRYPLFTDERGRVIDPYLTREVKNTIRAHAGEIQACFNAFVAQVSGDVAVRTAGTIHLDWRITAKGHVTHARTIYAELTDPALQRCIVAALQSWHFPPPGHDRYAEHTFRFQQQGE
jgi:hypothetical protein